MRWALVLIPLAACDPSARATGERETTAAPAAERRSAALETCARTADCEGELRCVDATCQPAVDSAVGELLAARGERALAAGRAGAAAEHFGAAVARYEADKLPPPARLLCGQGRALAATGDPKRAELGARLLHRCLMGTPAGAALHGQALADLASLHELGLEPEALARGEAADIYLSRTPAAPKLGAVKVSVAGDGRTRNRSYRELVTRLGADPAVTEALAPCLAAHAEATREKSVRVELRLRHSFRLDENDDFDRSVVAIAEPGQAENAARCVRSALEPLTAEIVRKLSDEARWEAPITVSLQG